MNAIEGISSQGSINAISQLTIEIRKSQTQKEQSQVEQELASEVVIKSGYLKKKGEQRRSWKQRWFVLRPNRLSYYQNDREYELLHIIELEAIHAVGQVQRSKKEHIFGIVTRQRTFYMQAETKEEMVGWLDAIRNQISKVLPNQITHTQDLIVPSSPNNEDGFGSPLESIPLSDDDQKKRDPSPGAPSVVTTGSVLSVGSHSLISVNESRDSIAGDDLAEFHTPAARETSSPPNRNYVPHQPPVRSSSSPTRISNLTRVSFSEPTRHPLRNPSLSPTHQIPMMASSSRSNSNPLDRTDPLRSNSNPLDRDQFSDSEEDEDKSHLSIAQVSNLAKAEQSLLDDQVIMCGYLEKLSNGLTRVWKRRWFVLRNGNLTSYKNDSEYEVTHIVSLDAVLDVLDIDPVDKKTHLNCFKVVLAKKSWILAAESQENMKVWIEKLNMVHGVVKGAVQQVE